MSTNYEYRGDVLYFNESGRWRKGELSNCKFCHATFAKRIGHPKKYCSKECAHIANQNRKLLSCDSCGKKFYRTQSKLKKSKSGLYFCSRNCKEKIQSLTSTHPKADLIRPPHFNSGCGESHYNILCKRTKKWECEDCGCSKSYMLCVHHIDGDRKNNPIDGSNWEVLCRNCHCKRHVYLNEEGEYVFWTQKLTPRELIPSL